MLASSFCNSQQVTAYSTMLSFTGSPYWMSPEVVVMHKNGYTCSRCVESGLYYS
ncbi:unnamed protein product [Brassica napus]|uniref:(rape) hypothetical protein n=1 Tax=Brassica napus TaxID=3708 RepID=A0A816II36_BRANA|nr:unnamed protein product [Brassica napus]